MPNPTPYHDARACVQAWFEVLGPMTGSSSDQHVSGVHPIEERITHLRRTHDRSEATRSAGIVVPLLDVMDGLELDLVDRLLLFGLLRDFFDPRSTGGLTCTRLCDAAGAAAWHQQDTVRERLADEGRLRTVGLVEDDGDRRPEQRFYRIPPSVVRPLLEGLTEHAAPVPPRPSPWTYSPETKRRDDVAGEGEQESPAECIETVTPRFGLDALVLPEDVSAQIRDALAVAVQPLALAKAWGMGEGLAPGAGAALLLFGPPGTGKTIAAEAIAGELKRKLLRVRIDQLLSRWVGGTEKRIARVFALASEQEAVVLLDEADALLSARGTADQRWEITQVNVLLLELERFPGVTILTTNRDQSLDQALERRLVARVELVMPGPRERLALWDRHLPPRAPLAEGVDLASLARDFPLSGSLIRTAVQLAAANAMRRAPDPRITQQDLADAAARQLTRAAVRKKLGFGSHFACAHNEKPARELQIRAGAIDSGEHHDD